MIIAIRGPTWLTQGENAGGTANGREAECRTLANTWQENLARAPDRTQKALDGNAGFGFYCNFYREKGVAFRSKMTRL